MIPTEMRGGVSLSGFAHRSRKIKVGHQKADSRTERLYISCNDEASPRSPHDLGCPNFGRDYYGNDAPHSLEHGVPKVFRVRW